MTKDEETPNQSLASARPRRPSRSQLRHELRTPLNAIIGYSELLMEQAADAGQEGFIADLRKIHAAGQKLLALLDSWIVDRGSWIAGRIPRHESRITDHQSRIPHPTSRTANLLVVDDDESNRDVLARQLAREGHTIAVAEDGVLALQMIQAQTFDLLLLDVMMPGMNGYQVLEQLKANEAWRETPVIMISALDELDSVVRCIELGAEDYLPKPFNPVLMRARIGACLEKNRLRQAQLAQQRAEEERMRRENETMLAILNQLHEGAIMTDAVGRVTFLSRAAERLIGQTPEEALGQRWETLLRLQEQDLARLKRFIDSPPVEPAKASIQMPGPGGRRYWLEIEVLADPRDMRRKIFFLYDVSEVYDLRRLLDDKAKFHDLVGQSKPMVLVYRQIQDLARVDTTVLVEGETGTGKELVARAIHYASRRKNKPFIAVNCAGLTESLLASQLFGHKRGAFTGAVADQVGVFEAANGGTLFLDEIGDVPLSVQTSLLRVLQEREITRLGEARPRRIDVRVIAATHHDLNQDVAAGRFRQDLLYRIRVARIQLPPLRERREDIPLLVAWFLGQFRASMETSVQEMSQDAMQVLLAYDWPGNVRELKSAIEAALVHCQGALMCARDLPGELTGAVALQPPSVDARQQKWQQVLQALERAGGNRAAAARLLGISRSTLYLWLEELGIK